MQSAKTHHHSIAAAAVALVAACSMLLPAGVASAAQAPGLSVKQGAGYTATKISHPNAGLGENDGIVNVDANGTPTAADADADRGQNYSWASVGYGDWMYVGTCYSAMGSTLKLMASKMGTTYSKLKAALDVAFNGELFLDNGENRSLLLKINTATGEVKIVAMPVQKSLGDDVNVNGYRAAIEFHDKLYFSAAATGKPYLLEVDPATDATKIVYQSSPLSPAAQKKGYSVGIRGLAVLGNQLVASMIGDDGAYIVASSDPSQGKDSFKVIATQKDLLDYPACSYADNIFGGAIWDMTVFNGKLYISVVTGRAGTKQSFALFRGEQTNDGSWKYTPLVGSPKDGARYDYGFGATRSGAANLVVYKNHLYIGGYNDPMVALPDALNGKFENLYNDMANSVNLWRMDADENFELVAGEDNNKYFGNPIGTIDGESMRAGLAPESDTSRHLNQYVWRMQSYDGKMYAGTFDISDLSYPVTQFANGDILHRTPEQWKKQIEYIKKFLEEIKGDGSSSANASADAKAGIATQSAESDASNGEIAKLERMESLMGSMQEDLNAKQTDANADGIATLSADSYTLEDRIRFQTMLEELLKIYESIKPMLPDSVTSELDKWLNQENVDNFGYFVNVCKYLHSATSDKRGCDLVVTADGVNFQTITRNGFGDNNNHGLRVFAVTNSGLSVGTANPYHGTQIWNLNDGTTVTSATLSAGNAFTYDKYDAAAKRQNSAGLNVGINFNGNTVSDVQYDYASLTAGKDYVVNADGSGISLTSTFLNAQKTGSTGSVTVFFNRGARVKFTVTITDGTPSTPQPSPSPASPSKPAADKAGKTSAGQTDGTTANTGSAVFGVAFAAAVLVLAAGVMLKLRRRD